MEYEKILRAEERVSAALRALYASWGFRPYKINRFEEYDLYMRFKTFLTDARVVTFTDPDGKLMALKPDVTLSVVKNAREEEYPLRIYYTENVYRVPKGAGGFREIPQTGIECIGDLTDWESCEALLLAAKSLTLVSGGRWRLDVSDLGVPAAVLRGEALTEAQSAAVLREISAKNVHGLTETCGTLGVSDGACALLRALVETTGPLAEAAAAAMRLPLPEDGLARLKTLRDMGLAAEALGLDGVALDFSVVSDMRYYNGLVFTGFSEGVPSPVLSGGRYDPLLARMGRSGSAVGFAVYLDRLDRLYPDTAACMPYRAPAGGTFAEKALMKQAAEKAGE